MLLFTQTPKYSLMQHQITTIEVYKKDLTLGLNKVKFDNLTKLSQY